MSGENEVYTRRGPRVADAATRAQARRAVSSPAATGRQGLLTRSMSTSKICSRAGREVGERVGGRGAKAAAARGSVREIRGGGAGEARAPRRGSAAAAPG